MGDRVTAIVLAAGRGRRMESSVQKQYMQLAGQPLICHALRAFEQSPVDDIVLVCGPGEEPFCRGRIVEPYGFEKVKAIVPGGGERYDSVYEGLKAAAGCDYVLIHDGARPCVTEKIIRAAMEGARQYDACVIAMPVKDTIKVAGADGFAVDTPPRSSLWAVQTPQAFSYPLVYEAYRRFLSGGGMPVRGADLHTSCERESEGRTPCGQGAEGQRPCGQALYGQQTFATDDAMVVERFMGRRVRLIRGSYENIKVTTPEDLAVAETFLRRNS